jgi:MtN3 and saliva related transmembrane protein
MPTPKGVGISLQRRTPKFRSMQHLIDIVGLVAAALTSLSYIPQVRKAWPRGSTGDLSSKMLAVLAAGLTTWIAYGILKGDYVIILANTVGVSLVAALLFFVWRDRRSPHRKQNKEERRRPF